MVPELNAKFAKEEARGLVVIGVTDEDPKLVEKFIKNRKAEYPIVILRNPQFEQALKVEAFPTGGVIDPKGNLTYAGMVSGIEGPLSKALEKATPGSIFPKRLEPSLKAFRARDLARAFAEALKVTAPTPVEKPWVERFRGFYEGEAKTALDDATKLAESGFIYNAVQRAQPVAKANPAFEAGKPAAEYLKKLEGEVGYAKEMTGGPLYLRAVELEEDKAAYTDAVNAYLDVVRRLPGTRIAEQAKAKAKEIVDKGLPGFKAACENCAKLKKACEKHHETLKV